MLPLRTGCWPAHGQALRAAPAAAAQVPHVAAAGDAAAAQQEGQTATVVFECALQACFLIRRQQARATGWAGGRIFRLTSVPLPGLGKVSMLRGARADRRRINALPACTTQRWVGIGASKLEVTRNKRRYGSGAATAAAAAGLQRPWALAGALTSYIPPWRPPNGLGGPQRLQHGPPADGAG